MTRLGQSAGAANALQAGCASGGGDRSGRGPRDGPRGPERVDRQGRPAVTDEAGGPGPGPCHYRHGHGRPVGKQNCLVGPPRRRASAVRRRDVPNARQARSSLSGGADRRPGSRSATRRPIPTIRNRSGPRRSRRSPLRRPGRARPPGSGRREDLLSMSAPVASTAADELRPRPVSPRRSGGWLPLSWPDTSDPGFFRPPRAAWVERRRSPLITPGAARPLSMRARAAQVHRPWSH